MSTSGRTLPGRRPQKARFFRDATRYMQTAEVLPVCGQWSVGSEAAAFRWYSRHCSVLPEVSPACPVVGNVAHAVRQAALSVNAALAPVQVVRSSVQKLSHAPPASAVEPPELVLPPLPEAPPEPGPASPPVLLFELLLEQAATTQRIETKAPRLK